MRDIICDTTPCVSSCLNVFDLRSFLISQVFNEYFIIYTHFTLWLHFFLTSSFTATRAAEPRVDKIPLSIGWALLQHKYQRGKCPLPTKIGVIRLQYAFILLSKLKVKPKLVADIYLYCVTWAGVAEGRLRVSGATWLGKTRLVSPVSQCRSQYYGVLYTSFYWKIVGAVLCLCSKGCPPPESL